MECGLNFVDTDTVKWNTPTSGPNGLEYSAYNPNSVHETLRLEPIQGVDNAPRINQALLDELAKNPVTLGNWSPAYPTQERAVRGGACVILCPGEWRLDTPIVMPNATELHLYGAHLLANHTGSMFEIFGRGVNPFSGNFAINSVGIFGNCNSHLHGEAIGSVGIEADVMDHCHFQNLIVRNFTDTGIKTSGSQYCSFRNIQVLACDYGAQLGVPPTSSGVAHHNNDWTRCKFEANRITGCRVQSGDAIGFHNCTFQFNPLYGLHLDPQVAGQDRLRGITLTSHHVESNGVHIRIDRPAGVQVSGTTLVGGHYSPSLNSPFGLPDTDRWIINQGFNTTVLGGGMPNAPAQVYASTTTGGATARAYFEQHSTSGNMVVVNFRGMADGTVANNISYATDQNGNIYSESIDPHTPNMNDQFRVITPNGFFGPNVPNI